MSAIGDMLRKELGLGTKYKLSIVDGDEAPHGVHEDGWTKWRNGRPVKYTRATNDLLVGRDWLHREFPATYAARRLGTIGQDEILPVDLFWRKWAKDHDQGNIIVPAWPSRDMSTCPEDERLYA